MSTELFVSDFSMGDSLVFTQLANRSWSKLQLVHLLPLHTLALLVKQKVLLLSKSEKTGLPSYALRDGFMNG